MVSKQGNTKTTDTPPQVKEACMPFKPFGIVGVILQNCSAYGLRAAGGENTLEHGSHSHHMLTMTDDFLINTVRVVTFKVTVHQHGG